MAASKEVRRLMVALQSLALVVLVAASLAIASASAATNQGGSEIAPLTKAGATVGLVSGLIKTQGKKVPGEYIVVFRNNAQAEKGRPQALVKALSTRYKASVARTWG